MIAIVLIAIRGRWIKGRKDLDFDNVPKILFRIKFPMAQVA
jgi:hypothetical protein